MWLLCTAVVWSFYLNTQQAIPPHAANGGGKLKKLVEARHQLIAIGNSQKCIYTYNSYPVHAWIIYKFRSYSQVLETIKHSICLTVFYIFWACRLVNGMIIKSLYNSLLMTITIGIQTHFDVCYGIGRFNRFATNGTGSYNH